MNASPQLYAERLCGHHNVARFDCGDPEFNRLLVAFQERFEQGENILAFVVVDDANAVLGYVMLAEAVLPIPGSDQEARCFTVPAMAVSKDYPARGVFEELRDHVIHVFASRQESARVYAGLICMPGENAVLERWLKGWAGFEPYGEGLVWIPLDVAS
jgi:hypothetical protein